jgi:hypothetical protein
MRAWGESDKGLVGGTCCESDKGLGVSQIRGNLRVR